ncbi:MAG TPA: HEAT repeat domain-containing protein [Pyrinomonadaceae bacterium]|nr:HEAT repeat domain-containing protein [Pyrinomonadaceae bacterium]
MLKPTALISILAVLVFFNVSCAYSRSAPAAVTSDPDVLDIEEGQTAKPQAPSFIPVEGADLKDRLDGALKKARAASPAKTLFWSAYSFDVRPGVAVDPSVHEFHGSMDNSGNTTVFVGTSEGMTVETRNLGIFILRDAANGTISRLEIYNLDKRHEYGGYPVYWLDRAGNDESLAYLRGFVEASPASTARQQSLLAEHATLAVGLHDDARVGAILKDFVRNSKDRKIRSTAIFWLGQAGEQGFLADLVRNEKEDSDLRSHAAHAIGESHDRSALGTLQSLYQTVSNRDVRRSLIHAIAENADTDAAIAFLLKVAKSDPDREARQQAIHRLGEVERESIIDDLMKIYGAESDRDVKQAVLHSLAEMEYPRAQSKLMEIARTDADPDLRQQAIHRLGEKGGDAVIEDLSKMYEAEHSQDVKQQILHAFSEMESQRAEDKLFAVARSDSNREMRKMAIHWIGERAGERSLELLRDTVNSNGADTEVQMMAVHAISERPTEEAVPLLIKIARTHPNSEIRKMAIHWLGESGDPRAIEFFKEVLTK